MMLKSKLVRVKWGVQVHSKMHMSLLAKVLLLLMKAIEILKLCKTKMLFLKRRAQVLANRGMQLMESKGEFV
jgi:hypothetical protein